MESPFYQRSLAKSVDPQEQHTPKLRESADRHYREFNSQVSIPEHFILSFDNLLSHIGFGRYQLWIYLIMALMSITEGAQITIFTLMIPILKNEWHISDQLNSFSASFVFVGFLLGSLLSGQLADRIGRKKPFFISSFFTTIVAFATMACQEIYSLLFLRSLMGILVGLFAPCGVTMLSEITPADLRGRYMGLITLTFAIGQLYGLVVAAFTLDTLDSGNWRALTFWCTLPGLAAWIVSLFKLEESPRFALLSGQKELAFKIIENMNNSNQGRLDINEETQVKILNWVHQMNRIARNQENASIASLFSNDRCKLTLLIWFNWLILSFVYYGIVMLLPLILDSLQTNMIGRDQILQLVLSCISDILGAFSASFFIERKGFGRKNSLIIFFCIQAFTSLMAYVDIESRFIVWATCSKFFLSMTFIFSFQYTAEVYPTKIRTTGIGMANGLGRMGVIIMPQIVLSLSAMSLRSPFALFFVLSLLACISNFFLPYDTMGKELEG